MLFNELEHEIYSHNYAGKTDNPVLIVMVINHKYLVAERRNKYV